MFKWTKDLPKIAGLYLMRLAGEVELTNVTEPYSYFGENELIAPRPKDGELRHLESVDFSDCEWAGPIVVED